MRADRDEVFAEPSADTQAHGEEAQTAGQLYPGDTGELETPILLRRSPLTFIDSVLLLYLRQVLVEAELRGQPALVDRDELADQLRLYEPADNTDRAGFEKRITAAIETPYTGYLPGLSLDVAVAIVSLHVSRLPRCDPDKP